MSKKPNQPQINHDEFIAVVEDLKQNYAKLPFAEIFEVSEKSMKIIIEHGNWFDNFLKNSRKAAAENGKKGGRPPEANIKPESLLKREFREARKENPALTWADFTKQKKGS